MSDAITSRKVKQVEGRVGRGGGRGGGYFGTADAVRVHCVCVLSPASEHDVLRRDP